MMQSICKNIELEYFVHKQTHMFNGWVIIIFQSNGL